jgi:aminoglycoside/choline kinase family phosphotransferase
LKFNEEQFIIDYNILSLQRNIKIFGIFARQAVKNGREDYLPLIPKRYVQMRFGENNLAKIKDKNFLNIMLQLKELLLKFI